MVFDARVIDGACSDEDFGSDEERARGTSKGSRGEAGLSAGVAGKSPRRRSASCPKTDRIRSKSRDALVVPGECAPDPDCHTPVSVCSNIPAMNIPRFPSAGSHIENCISMISPSAAGSRLHNKRKSTPQSEAIASLGLLAHDADVRRYSKSNLSVDMAKLAVTSRRSSISSVRSFQQEPSRNQSPHQSDRLSADKMSDNKSGPDKSEDNKSCGGTEDNTAAEIKVTGKGEPVNWQQPMSYVDPYQELYESTSCYMNELYVPAVLVTHISHFIYL